MDNTENRPANRNRHGRVWAALLLMLIGGMLVLQQLGLDLPYWLFTWPMILITLGIFIGFKHGFRGGAWLALLLIGGFFLVDDVMPGFSFHRFFWPGLIILLGFIILIRPRKPRDWSNWEERWKEKEEKWKTDWKNIGSGAKSYSSEDFIDGTTIFGGIHKTSVSKNFRGGDITVFMGGSEINLSQADINGTAVLDITQVMGGSKLIVPPNWEIRTNISSVFGNVEDKRTQERITNPDKVLIIDGVSVFGGIEIRNY